MQNPLLKLLRIECLAGGFEFKLEDRFHERLVATSVLAVSRFQITGSEATTATVTLPEHAGGDHWTQ